MTGRITALILIFTALFAGGVLWRVDEALYGDRIQWQSGYLSQKVQSLSETIRNDVLFWKISGTRELSLWPHWLASVEVGKWDETFLWRSEDWGPRTTRTEYLNLLKSMKIDSKTSDVQFQISMDEDKKVRVVAWIPQGTRLIGLVINTNSWLNRQLRGDETFLLNNEGLAILHSKKDYVGQKMTSHPLWIQLNKDRDQDRFQGLLNNAEGASSSMVAEKVPGTNLIAGISQPVSDVMIGRQGMRVQIIVFALGIAFLLLAFVYMDSNKETVPRNQTLVHTTSGAFPTRTQIPPVISQKQILNAQNLDRIDIYKNIAGAVSHELKAPLISILAHAQQLSNQDEHGATILRDARDAKSILDKLIGFSGMAATQKIEMKLETPIRKALKKLESFLQSRNIRVITKFEDKNLHYLDQETLVKALTNIIQNAGEAMERQLEKVLTISLKSEQSETILSIEDNGQGMDAETLSRAKDPFFSKRSYANHLGLGLSEAEGIFKEHGAVLQIHSEVGKGTKIQIVFPVQATPKTTATHEQPLEEKAKAHHEEPVMPSPKVILEKMDKSSTKGKWPQLPRKNIKEETGVGTMQAFEDEQTLEEVTGISQVKPNPEVSPDSVPNFLNMIPEEPEDLNEIFDFHEPKQPENIKQVNPKGDDILTPKQEGEEVVDRDKTAIVSSHGMPLMVEEDKLTQTQRSSTEEIIKNFPEKNEVKVTAPPPLRTAPQSKRVDQFEIEVRKPQTRSL